LTATPSGGTAPYNYIWSTGETTPSINVNKSGTYTVTVADKTPGCPAVKQSITVSSSPTPNAPTAKGVVVCPNTSATLTATAPGGLYQWYDAPTGGNFLGSGDTYTTPPITNQTFFYVETTISGCTSPRTAVLVSLTAKPVVTGASICAGNSATLTASGGDTYAWYDSAGNLVGTGPSYTTPVLVQSRTYYVEITTNGCTGQRTPIEAKVSPPPQAPTAANVTICSGSSANLHADAPAGIFNWYSVPFGGTPLISSPDYTTPPLNSTTVYYVETSLNQCESPRTRVTVTVNPQPVTPAAQNDTACYGTSVALTASANPSGTYQWYDAPTGGNLLATGNVYNTPVLKNAATYYVQANNGGCISQRAQVNVAVRPQLPVPSVSGAIICYASAATLTATGPGGTYRWYSAAAGGKLLATGPSYTTPILKANTTYYVQTTIGTCTSGRAAVTVSVLAPIAAPTASGTSVCSGSSATLTATGSTGNYAWYDSAAGGNLLSSAQVYVTPALAATTTYYVEATSKGCSSARVAVKVTVSPSPAPPTASGTTVCPNTRATLTASTPTGSIRWYDAPTGGTLLRIGTTYQTPVLSSNTTYYAEATNGTCTSTRTAVTVTMGQTYDPQFQYPFGTFCSTGSNPTPVINNPAGGTFSAAPAGLVFVSTTTGQINIAASTPGAYTISFAGNGACAGVTTAKVTIATTTNASFSYNGPYCQGGPNPLPTFPAGASAGSFSASPAGLVFVNSSTGEIDLSNSNFGTYTITNTINASGGCPASVATSTVTINQMVTVSAGPPQTVPKGTKVQLAGSISGGTTTGKWSGGTGSFSNPTLPNAVYTPGPGETSATLTLTSSNPPGPCGAKSDKVTITFSIQPPPPTAKGAATCAGSSVVLSATAPGGTYEWFDAAADGNLLNTGPTFTTPALNANTTYYVQTTVNGLTSSRTAVTATVNATPAPPTAAGAQICEGSTVTLKASGSPGTYQWYDAAAGGNLLSANASYTTPGLTNNTSYYVQTTVGGCISSRTQVDVTVTPIPNVTSRSTDNICSGDALNYTITADVAAATFSWSRAKVAGISNPGVNGQTSPTITETLINTTIKPIDVTYVITPVIGNCSGPPFNYVVTVYPTPTVTSGKNATICNMTTDNYAVTFSSPGVIFSWSRDAVAGISNAPVTGQAASVIKEVLFNTSNAPVDVTYVFNYKTSSCPGVPFNLVITVNPQPLVTSASSGIACSGQAQNYAITSNIPNATYNWSRDAVPGISNPAVANQTSDVISEALNNTTAAPVQVVYNITPITNGCAGTPFKYTVAVNPPITVPVANSNSPVCVGSIIHLRTNPIPKATYLWTGPNGYSSALQSPDIDNVTAANSGTYTLVVTVNGCSTLPVTTEVVVDEPPTADAGPDQVVCILNPSIFLTGSIGGGTSTGIWTTQGTGTFSPSANTLNAQYIPSAADRTAGSVVLILASTSKDDCTIATDTMTVKFGPLPAVDAGPDQDVCSQATAVQLKGTASIPGTLKWTTTGSGSFTSDNQLNTTYIPSPSDVQFGAINLALTISGAGPCYIPADTMVVRFIPPPKVSAGGTRYVLKGHTITLYPSVGDSNVQYLWSPNIDINDVTAKNPIITGDVDRTYKLTITDSRGCVNQDTARIIVSPEIKINNTFTPNADGINDYWDITGLIAYTDATVDIFDRYGQKVFHSLSYPKPWDGNFNGKPLPVGVYYYVINTHVNGQVLSGYVTIIR